MTVRATIVIPTHDHGPTLSCALASAVSQTISEIEVFVVGDGVPDATRRLAREWEGRDPRVRFFDHPKGPRHGEIHRHADLAHAHGEIVCYLSDDDLYFPGHVETMLGLLRQADFATTQPILVFPDGSMRSPAVDLARPSYRRLLLSGHNRVPLSCGAHTLATYRRLPFGWRTTPAGVHTDLYMWQQFLAQAGCVPASSTRPTVLHFPASKRPGMSLDDRVAELRAWETRLASPESRDALGLELLECLGRECVRLDEKLSEIQRSQAYRLVRRIRRPFARLPGP